MFTWYTAERARQVSDVYHKRPAAPHSGQAVRKVLREGDRLVITKVDRLARSLLDLITIADDLRKTASRWRC
jgi:DNA invertase Pin-like site-specific DNA recombinase